MATSYTSLLGFALPVTGELSGTWGDVVNDNITKLVEDSIAGTATASVASGDWTLTTTGSGAANQARCAILIPTGSPGVSRNIIAPSQSKAYVVINQSDGAIVLKSSATTGTTIAANTKALCAWNGSDFVTVATADIGNLSGTLPVSKGGTGQTSYTDGQLLIGNSSGNTLTKATLTQGSGVTITNGNGSITISATGSGGDAVLANNNAFTGANTFYNSTGQTFGTATSTNDGIVLAGRAGGTNTYRATLTPDTLTGNRTLTIPDASGTILQSGTAVTVAQGGTGLTSGTSGGIPYYSSTSAITSSALLAANNFLIGGGAGAAPSSTSLLALSAAVTTGNFVKAAGYADTVTALGNTGTAINIDATSGGVFTATLTGNCTFTLRYPVSSGASSFILILTNDGTAGRTVAWAGGTFRYPGGTVTRTTTANAVDIWFLMTPNGGTTWYVSIPMANLS